MYHSFCCGHHATVVAVVFLVNDSISTSVIPLEVVGIDTNKLLKEEFVVASITYINYFMINYWANGGFSSNYN